MYGDMFSMDFKNMLHVTSYMFYLYISPWHLEKTLSNIKRQFKHFSVVSYMYEIPLLKPSKKIKGKKHDVFVYTI